jgi:hypothetical protein
MKCPESGTKLVVSARGERSVGIMPGSERPEIQHCLLTHVGGHTRRHGVTSGGQHDQRHVTVTALGINHLASAPGGICNRRSLCQQPRGVGVESSKARRQARESGGHWLRRAPVEPWRAAFQRATPKLSGALAQPHHLRPRRRIAQRRELRRNALPDCILIRDGGIDQDHSHHGPSVLVGELQGDVGSDRVRDHHVRAVEVRSL